MKIVFLDTYSVADTDLSPLESRGEFIAYENTSPGEVVERCREAEIVITNKVKLFASEIERLPALRLICVAATGTNNVDTEYAGKRGITVKNVAGYSTASVAECTLMLALALSHQLPYYDNFVKKGGYSASGRIFHLERPFSEMSEKTWGIVGLGSIGRRVAELAAAFGAKICYYSTSGKNHNDRYTPVTLEQLLSASDIISIHAPLNEQTEGLISYGELQRMKPSACLINTARGGIVDEAALAHALDNGLIAGAATDVFSEEPLPAGSPLLHLKDPTRLLLTPHLAWASDKARKQLVAGIAGNISEYIGQEPTIRS